MQDNYKRNPKDPGGSKWISGEDFEDCEQEKLIQAWLKEQGNVGAVELKHINRKGTARNTLVKAEVRLDQKVREDGESTFADFIAGCDGRDLYGGGGSDELEPEPQDKIHGYLFALGFNQGEIKWLIRIFKSSITERQLHSEKFLTDSELWKQFEPFST
jgi:hypothetical protein